MGDGKYLEFTCKSINPVIVQRQDKHGIYLRITLLTNSAQSLFKLLNMALTFPLILQANERTLHILQIFKNYFN